MSAPLASPARVAQLAAAHRRRPPCPIDPDCQVDHLTGRGVRRSRRNGAPRG